MIKTEQLTINGKAFTRTWSDENRYVVRDGVEYSEAYDPSELGRTYTEGEVMEDYSTEDDAKQIIAILTGESE